MKQINELTGTFKPEMLALAEQADMRFVPELGKSSLIRSVPCEVLSLRQRQQGSLEMGYNSQRGRADGGSKL